MTRVQKHLHFYLLLALSCLSSFPCHVVLEKVSSSYTQTLRQQDSPCRVWTFLQSFSTTMWFFFSLVSNSGNSWIFFSHFCHPLSDLHASWAFLRSSFFSSWLKLPLEKLSTSCGIFRIHRFLPPCVKRQSFFSFLVEPHFLLLHDLLLCIMYVILRKFFKVD